MTTLRRSKRRRGRLRSLSCSCTISIPTARSVFGCFVGEATGDLHADRDFHSHLRRQRWRSIASSPSNQFGRGAEALALHGRITWREPPSLLAAIRLCCSGERFDLTQPAEAASCRLCAP